MSKQKQEIIPKYERVERVERAQTTHNLSDQKKRSKESLTAARKNKDDEFYTYYEDIENAVNLLEPDALRGLSVLCPFDNPEIKFDGTEPFEIINKINPYIKGKRLFTRLLVRYTG